MLMDGGAVQSRSSLLPLEHLFYKLTDVIDPAAAVQPLPELLERLRGSGLRRGVGLVAGEAAERAAPGARGAIPTGFAALDDALRTGGWPRGSLALLDAPRGAGATSLAIRSLASAQAAGGIVAWIDAAGCLDPASVERGGVSLEWLLVVRPASVAEGLELAGWIARGGLVDALVLDLGEGRGGRGSSALVAGLDRLGRLLAHGRSVTLLLAGERWREAVGRVASVRLSLRREAWLAVGRDLVGQRVRATVDRNRWALAGAAATLDLWFAEGRRVDPLLPSLAVPDEVVPDLEHEVAVPDVADLADLADLADVAAREERPALRLLSA
jgi:recA bacterial DNA recombination protein